MPLTRNQIISSRLLALIGAGKTPAQAIDAVFGNGTFEKLAGEVYDELRAKAVQS